MANWFVPEHQQSLANQTVTKFGIDHQGIINYQFNSLGFRSSEPGQNPRLVTVGNSIAFGVGVPYQQTFSFKLAQKFGLQNENYSFGCYLHENHDHLNNISTLANQDIESIFIIQFNNLSRKRLNSESVVIHNNSEENLKKFLEYYEQVTDLLRGRLKFFLYWDSDSYQLPDSISRQILIRNKFHLDSSIPGHPETFGPNSHRAIYQVLSHKIAV